MKTLILLLAAAMSAPALAQDSYETTTSSPAPAYETPSSSSSDLSGSSSDTSSDYNSNLDQSSGSATMNPDTTDSSATPDYSNDSSWNQPSEATAPSGSSTLQPSSGSATTSTTETPPAADNVNAPTAEAPATAAASEENTSRSWHEEMGRNLKPGGFYIEPAILGTREDADIKGNLAGADNTGTSNGFGADLKLGGHIGEIVFLAADGRYERTRFADSSYTDQDSNVWNWGPTVGIQAPWAGMRVWGTYIVDGNFDPNSGANGTDLKFKDPYGWRGGVGFRISNVSLNLEYEDLTYRTTDVQSLGNVAVGTSTNVDFAQRGYALSLSFPIQL